MHSRKSKQSYHCFYPINTMLINNDILLVGASINGNSVLSNMAINLMEFLSLYRKLSTAFSQRIYSNSTSKAVTYIHNHHDFHHRFISWSTRAWHAQKFRNFHPCPLSTPWKEFQWGNYKFRIESWFVFPVQSFQYVASNRKRKTIELFASLYLSTSI